VKDFGDSIPGHGGITDRFDCQMLMATFAFLYFRQYVAAHEGDDRVLASVLDWSLELQVRVFRQVADVLVLEGVLAPELLSEALAQLQGAHLHAN